MAQPGEVDDADRDITESGRPRVPRPMPDTVDVTHCPHCDAEIGAGHAVCWNCSKDVRMREQTEAEILDEYHEMVARTELRLEARNRTFFVALATFLAFSALASGVWRPDLWGLIVIFGVLSLLAVRFAVRTHRRMARIAATLGN